MIILEIRKILKEETKEALELVWKVFLEYEAPDYSEDGIIALFFVDGKYHKQGIGRKLYNKILSINNKGFFTVNSSPYAHEVYKHLGFTDTNSEQCVNGLRFYPMKMEL